MGTALTLYVAPPPSPDEVAAARALVKAHDDAAARAQAKREAEVKVTLAVALGAGFNKRGKLVPLPASLGLPPGGVIGTLFSLNGCIAQMMAQHHELMQTAVLAIAAAAVQARGPGQVIFDHGPPPREHAMRAAKQRARHRADIIMEAERAGVSEGKLFTLADNLHRMPSSKHGAEA